MSKEEVAIKIQTLFHEEEYETFNEETNAICNLLQAFADEHLEQKVNSISDEYIERCGFSDVIALAGKNKAFQEGAKWAIKQLKEIEQ